MTFSEVSRGEQIRVRGLVQGVGFRPQVWRIAKQLGLAGDVRNDGEGVLIRIWANSTRVGHFCERLIDACPPLGRIDSLERSVFRGEGAPQGFSIVASTATSVRTGIVPDAATCPACLSEIRDPTDRRYRYPFTNCTHCGPRLSIVHGIPYDRCNTSMSAFSMCERCSKEYRDPADRRFHAQPNACPACGPRAWLEGAGGKRLEPSDVDADDTVAAASRLLAQGKVLALKGIGGFHLACDACDEAAVSRLRLRKRRFRKPFALMARDLEVVRRYCRVAPEETELLAGPAAPVVLLELAGSERVAGDVAPGQTTLGMMLPYSPLHHLLLQDWDRPLVMTSGNLSEEPQCIDNKDARQRLDGLADYYLLHDRDIRNRVDDSVVRLMDGAPRLSRRARGYAPAPIQMPEGFGEVPHILALGGELKNSIGLLANGRAVMSQHLGDLEEAHTAAEYARTIALYRALFQQDPEILAVDLHPSYRSSQFGRSWAAEENLELVEVQHHFAHIASVLAENGWPLDAGPVVGIALDGLGYGDDGTLWGGEFLIVDYRGYERAGHFKPAPLLGGGSAILEPWRNAYAQLVTHLGWDEIERCYPNLDLTRYLTTKPLQRLDTMLARGINSPLSSSCGRLFDAVAAALGISRDRATYEGQAAIELEAAAVPAMRNCGLGYPFEIRTEKGSRILDPRPMWSELLGDLVREVEVSRVAARFHAGLADAVAQMSISLAEDRGIGTLALSGGVLQNRILLETISERLRAAGLQIFSHKQVPSNDGGISLGQAVIAAACHTNATC